MTFQECPHILLTKSSDYKAINNIIINKYFVLTHLKCKAIIYNLYKLCKTLLLRFLAADKFGVDIIDYVKDAHVANQNPNITTNDGYRRYGRRMLYKYPAYHVEIQFIIDYSIWS